MATIPGATWTIGATALTTTVDVHPMDPGPSRPAARSGRLDEQANATVAAGMVGAPILTAADRG